MTVTLRRNDGREQSFRIVGEDEADPSRGTVSYFLPVARACLLAALLVDDAHDRALEA
jgi:transcription elongation GreA/GreB family factor